MVFALAATSSQWHPKTHGPYGPWHTRLSQCLSPSVPHARSLTVAARIGPNARKCYGCMSIHMRTKRAKNDTKVIKRDAVSSKNVQNQYDFVLPNLTSLLHTPRGASAKAVLWITWPKKARQTAPKTCFSENGNATYSKNRDKGIGNRQRQEATVGRSRDFPNFSCGKCGIISYNLLTKREMASWWGMGGP